MQWLQEDGYYRTFWDELVEYIAKQRGKPGVDLVIGGQTLKYLHIEWLDKEQTETGDRYTFECRAEGCEESCSALVNRSKPTPLNLTCIEHDSCVPEDAWLPGSKIAERHEAEYRAWQDREIDAGRMPRRRGTGPISALMHLIDAAPTPPKPRVGTIEQVVLGVLADLAILGTTPTAEMVIAGSKPKLVKPRGKDCRRKMARDALRTLERKGLAQVVW